ncbi:transcriptional regulator, LacI family [Albimonas donghaensis]|uniref:Transcriptional regulator, LacI family n=1 Tax=Albimonas donghaensis TaxID=356660 RepID=A0A1H3DPS3_9RHOB|nr:LacI family DNA-binding transcriptional regulator [Albimonas donghaensis]SDX67659.1 transcriptional regulator, LacI family [Albimonas donghaensis]
MDRKQVTIQDVAREAGVSTATVSRTLSKPTVVAKPTRQAVLRAVQKTGYQVNHLARNLRRGRTGSVIALAPNLANPFFSQILAGMSEVLSARNYGLLIADTQMGPDPDERLRRYLAAGAADGLVLFDGSLSPAALDVPGRPPVVAACEWLKVDLPSIRVDNAMGAELAVAHLADLGHSRIGHVTGPRRNVLARTRLAGWRDAMTRRGLDPREGWVFEGDFSMDSGAMAARRWLAAPDRPTALFFASDEMAVGFLGEARRADIRAPRDVSVVGFDNIEVAAHLDPPLTTIRQPRTLIGQRAAALLMDLIEGGDGAAFESMVEVDLILRDSTAPPPPPAPAGQASSKAAGAA